MSALAIVALVLGIALGSLGGDDDGTPPPGPVPPPVSEPGTPSPREPATTAPQPPAPETPRPTDNERTREQRDLIDFKLDDRSASGFKNIWVTWTITNHSSEKSDYTWDWEAVAPNGVRVADSTEHEFNVQPGQTVKGDFFTTLDTTDVKLNITSFDRTASP
ncbi:hypothetical protein J7E93_07755 [Streptomyces sp. ISL-36]|nr:hypothetical protein [Streptomyces sp. ISL-36]